MSQYESGGFAIEDLRMMPSKKFRIIILFEDEPAMKGYPSAGLSILL